MTTAMQNGHVNGQIIERVIAAGDLDGLQPIERARYYTKVCESLGLNALTQPFQYIRLQGKLTLYAKKDTSDQLRMIHNVSIHIISRELDSDGVLTVTARAKMPSGREDESSGCVHIAGLKGEALANAKMKAETKAKRRATLSICGLGWLDESEISSIPSAKPVQVTAEGEIVEESLVKQLAASIDWQAWQTKNEDKLRAAAGVDLGALNEAWTAVNEDIKKMQPPPERIAALKKVKDELKKVRAANTNGEKP